VHRYARRPALFFQLRVERNAPPMVCPSLLSLSLLHLAPVVLRMHLRLVFVFVLSSMFPERALNEPLVARTLVPRRTNYSEAKNPHGSLSL